MAKAEPKYVAATLAWCNTIRAEDGKAPLERLPLGQLFHGRSCPCGAATGWWVGHETCLRPDGMRIPTPAPVSRFTHAFDEGRLPQYDKERGAQGVARAPQTKNGETS